jgi:hypothetical protein
MAYRSIGSVDHETFQDPRSLGFDEGPVGCEIVQPACPHGAIPENRAKKFEFVNFWQQFRSEIEMSADVPLLRGRAVRYSACCFFGHRCPAGPARLLVFSGVAFYNTRRALGRMWSEL